eukprot:582294_1
MVAIYFAIAFCLVSLSQGSPWKYNTIKIQFEKSTTSAQSDNSNQFMHQLVGIPSQKDIVITGFKSHKPNDQLRIQLNNDHTPIWLKPNDKWSRFKWIDNDDKCPVSKHAQCPLTFTSLAGDDKQILSVEQLMEMVLQRRVGIDGRSTKHNKLKSPSRVISPKALKDVIQPDAQREPLKVQTNTMMEAYAQGQLLKISNFDMSDAGWVLGQQRGWFKMVELQIKAELVLHATTKNALYFLERIPVKPYYYWKPYHFVKRVVDTTPFDDRLADVAYKYDPKYQFEEIVRVDFEGQKSQKEEYGRRKKQELKAKEIDDLAQRGMIAFDGVGKYLLIGKRNKDNGASKKRVNPLHFSAKVYEDVEDNNEDSYYEQYYYEDTSRLLRWANEEL